MKHLLVLASALLLVSYTAFAVPSSTTPYERHSGCEKQDILWSQFIEPSTYETLPDLDISAALFKRFLASPTTMLDLSESFTHQSDFMPAGRAKIIHPFGTVAKVVFKSSGGHGYSGLFADREVCGLARLSLAGSPLMLGFVPGAAFKFFVDGQPSVNFHVLNSLQGQGSDDNFFRRTFSNDLPPIEVSLTSPASWALKALEEVFATVKPDPRHLSVDDAATWNADGTREDHVVAPYIVLFVPSAALTRQMDDLSGQDFRRSLETIPAGTMLYTVYAQSSGQRTLIGEVTTESMFVASKFGDDNLFFKHQR